MFRFCIKKLKIEISPFFIILPFVVFTPYVLPQFAVLFFCLALHEAAHITAAHALGISTEKLVVLPIGFTAVMRSFNSNRLGKKLAVIAAGSAFNIVIAAPVYLFHGFCMFVTVNLLIAFVNLLPVYPLDGGRMLQCLSAEVFGTIRSCKLTKRIGMFFSVAVVAAGAIYTSLFPYDLTIVIMGAYLLSRAKKESASQITEFYTEVAFGKGKLEENPVCRVKLYLVSPDTPLKSLLDLITPSGYNLYRVGTGQDYYCLTEEEVAKKSLEFGVGSPLSECVTAIAPDDTETPQCH